MANQQASDKAERVWRAVLEHLTDLSIPMLPDEEQKLREVIADAMGGEE